MEPITTGAIAGWAAECITVKGVEFLLKGANSQLKGNDVRKAINKGIQVVTEKHNLLFYRCPPDFIKRFLNQFFEQQVKELQKPLNGEGQSDVDFLAKAFEKTGKEFFGDKGELDNQLIKPWLKVFCQTYFANTNAFLKFQVAKEDYFQQLANWFDDVKFAGMPVAGQEVEKSEKLAQIFVMPDVVEDVGTDFVFDLGNYGGEDARQQALLDQQRLRASSKPSGRKFLASQLLQQTDSKKFILLGAPGSGKTTLASYFAVMLAQGETEKLGLDPDVDYLPIIIRIRDLAREENVSILEFAKDFAEKRLTVKDLPTGFFNYCLEDGRAVILLDGLDEVAETGKRYDIVSRIENFLGQFPENLAIITSRPAGYKRDFFRTEEFPHFELQAFGDDKVEEFINRWYDSRVKDQAEAARRKESLQKALEENERIKLLARNPLLLTIIALIHRYQAVLPKERFKLYDKAVETLIISWDAKKEITAHKKLQYLSLDDLRRILEIIAYWIHTEGNTGDQEGGTLIDCEELLGKLKREIKTLKGIQLYEAENEAERFLSLIQERTGLLNEQGQDCYAFVHKTFQEYLCAQAIDYEADNEGDFEIILDHVITHLHDPHWREVLLLLIAQQKPKKAAKAIRVILNKGSDYEQWLHRDLFFAGSCLAEDIKGLGVADSGLVEEILSQLLALEMSDDNRVGWQIREQGFKTARRFCETAFEEQFLGLLKGEGEKIDKVRLQKYRAELGEREDAITSLIKLCKNDDYDVRSRAPLAFVTLGEVSEKVISTLISLLSDHDEQVRSYTAIAVNNLGKISGEVLTALIHLLSDDYAEVRGSAADALARLGELSEEVVNVLLPLLGNGNPLERSWTAYTLSKLGKASEDVLSTSLFLLNEKDFLVRSGAAYALSELGRTSENLVNVLLPLLDDEHFVVRYAAASGLGISGKASEDVLSALLSLFNDNDFLVRVAAASALGNLGKASNNVVSTLFSTISNDVSLVKFAAAASLYDLGKASEKVLSTLLALLRDGDFQVRQSSANALGRLGKQDFHILPQLVQWLQENEDYPNLGDGINALWQIVN